MESIVKKTALIGLAGLVVNCGGIRHQNDTAKTYETKEGIKIIRTFFEYYLPERNIFIKKDDSTYTLLEKPEGYKRKYTKLTIKDKEEEFGRFIQSETRYKNTGHLTIVYFVNINKGDSTKEVIVAGITRRGIKPYIDVELIEKGSKLESEVKTDLEKEGNKMIFW